MVPHTKQRIIYFVAFILALSAVLATFFLQVDSKALVATGYGGVFIVALLSAASLVPGPSVISTVLAGGVLPPLLVSIVAGLGSAIGETSGYLAGYGSHGVINDSAPKWLSDNSAYRWFQQKVLIWMKRNSFITIFTLAAVPNFFVDVAGIIAGRARYPIPKFFVAMFLGKTVRFALAAYLGFFLFK